MSLVKEPLEGTDIFAPGHEDLFFNPEITAPPSAATSPAPSDAMEVEVEDEPETHVEPDRSNSHLSPCQTGAPLLVPSPSSTAPSPLPRLTRDAYSPVSAAGSLRSPLPDRAPPSQLVESSALPHCYISPALFCLWTSNAETRKVAKIFAKFDERKSVPEGTVMLEDLREWETKYPRLVEMYHHLPCAFFHVRINLDLPTSGTSKNDQFNSILKITSETADMLSVATTIYSSGSVIIAYEEDLDAPLLAPQQPRSPTDRGDTAQYVYSAPFAALFWSVFLRGVFELPITGSAHSTGSFVKVGKERRDFATAIEGFSVVQEFFVRDEPGAPQRNGVSPGSEQGNVVLVLVHDMEASLEEERSSGEISINSLQVCGAGAGYESPVPTARVLPFSPPLHPTSLMGRTIKSSNSEVQPPRRNSDLGYPYSLHSQTLDSVAGSSKLFPPSTLRLPVETRRSQLPSHLGSTTASSSLMSRSVSSPSILPAASQATAFLTPWNQSHSAPSQPPSLHVAGARVVHNQHRLEAHHRAQLEIHKAAWEREHPTTTPIVARASTSVARVPAQDMWVEPARGLELDLSFSRETLEEQDSQHSTTDATMSTYHHSIWEGFQLDAVSPPAIPMLEQAMHRQSWTASSASTTHTDLLSPYRPHPVYASHSSLSSMGIASFNSAPAMKAARSALPDSTSERSRWGRKSLDEQNYFNQLLGSGLFPYGGGSGGRSV